MSGAEDLIPFDAADFLTTPQRITAYLNAALAEKDTAFVMEALGTVARARGMTALAEQSGVPVSDLDRALSANTHAEFEMVARVVAAMGLKLQVVAA